MVLLLNKCSDKLWTQHAELDKGPSFTTAHKTRKTQFTLGYIVKIKVYFVKCVNVKNVWLVQVRLLTRQDKCPTGKCAGILFS